MNQKDWLERQLEAVSISIAQTVFKKDRPDYEIVFLDQTSDSDLLHKRLMELLENSQINEAENLLFESIDVYDESYLSIAIDFYSKLTEYDDDYLKQSNFLRDEIKMGLQEVKKMFGLEG